MQRTPESCAVKSSPIDKFDRGGGFRRNSKPGVTYPIISHRHSCEVQPRNRCAMAALATVDGCKTVFKLPRGESDSQGTTYRWILSSKVRSEPRFEHGTIRDSSTVFQKRV